MASMSLKPEPQEEYQLLTWPERKPNFGPSPHWYRIVLIRDKWQDVVGVYCQKTREPVPFAFMVPKDGWETITYDKIRGSDLATKLELWGIKPSRTKIERASDV